MSIFSEKMGDAFATGERIVELLEGIEQNLADSLNELRARGDQETFRRQPLVGVSDAAGVCDLTYSTPVGLGVRLISAACSGAAPGAGVEAAIYLGDPSNDANLIHVFGYSTARFSSNFAEGEYVPAGSTITIRFRTQGVGTRCTANLKLVVENPTEAMQVR